MIKSILLHISMNMWEDRTVKDTMKYHPDFPEKLYGRVWSDDLRCDDGVWKRVTQAFADAGGNMVILDIGDAVKTKSHPDISVNNAWSVQRLKDELTRLRDMGLEPIPKLNFSAGHDAWMRRYGRMVSSKPYYDFCHDMIAEMVEHFDGPRFFQIGMDEEEISNQWSYEYICARKDGLWWHDLNFFADETRNLDSRAWMWADKIWHCSDEEFAANVPRDIIQSNWAYGNAADFKLRKNPETGKDEYLYIQKAYRRLERLGYDQIPTGSNWDNPESYLANLEFAFEHIDKSRLLGFMMAPWFSTLPSEEPKILAACKQVKEAHEKVGK